MMNLAGPSFDYGPVLFAVLTDCEHRRRSLDPEELEAKLTGAAREKLGEIRDSYVECGGGEEYFTELSREVLETALPQYLDHAAEQNRLEQGGYNLWRGGDPVARVAFGLLGLLLGGILIALPFIPIWEDSFAFLLALAGFLFPEVHHYFFDRRHARFLNRLIHEGESYQSDRRVHYLSNAKFDEALRTMVESGRGSAEESRSAAEVAAEPRFPEPKAPAISLPPALPVPPPLPSLHEDDAPGSSGSSKPRTMGKAGG